MGGKEIKNEILWIWKDNERLMKLSEVTFDGTLEELEDLINFWKMSKKSILRW